MSSRRLRHEANVELSLVKGRAMDTGGVEEAGQA
jgi:hypothetical protein